MFPCVCSSFRKIHTKRSKLGYLRSQFSLSRSFLFSAWLIAPSRIFEVVFLSSTLEMSFQDFGRGTGPKRPTKSQFTSNAPVKPAPSSSLTTSQFSPTSQSVTKVNPDPFTQLSDQILQYQVGITNSTIIESLQINTH
jgi:hypothetical protein